MADLTEPFNMEPITHVTSINRDAAYQQLVGIMTAIYDEMPYKHSVLETSEMRVFACKRFGAWVETHEGDYWAAMTSAVQDTLQKYPLRGQ